MALSEKAALNKDTRAGYAKMEHRHFATIAAIIQAIPDADLTFHTADHFAKELARTNPRFDKARFLKACGVE